MPDTGLADLRQLIEGVRRSFWLLSALSGEALADLGLTAATRAILEHAAEHGPQSVPQIAAAKHVKRQSIQALVDQTVRLGLIRLADNPAHRRSPLVDLTASGRKIFAEVRRREARLMRAIVARLRKADLAAAAAVLGDLPAILNSMLERGRDEPET